MKIILITGSCIGDAVMTTGILNYYIKKYSNANITIACSPAVAPLFAGLPGLDTIITMPTRKRFLRWWRVWSYAVKQRWDIVIDFKKSLISFAVLTRHRHIPKGRDAVFKHRVIEYAEQFCLPVDEATITELWPDVISKTKAEHLIENDADFIVLAPTAGWAGKEWPMERFVQASLMLTATDGVLPGARIAVAGAFEDIARTRKMLSMLPQNRKIDLVGVADLGTVYFLLQRAKLFIGNESGLMHLAAATGCPTVGLIGPTNKLGYYPWGKHAIAISTPESMDELKRIPFHGQSYMLSLKTETVIEAAEQLVGSLNLEVLSRQ
jgi:heptosyltransferase III